MLDDARVAGDVLSERLALRLWQQPTRWAARLRCLCDASVSAEELVPKRIVWKSFPADCLRLLEVAVRGLAVLARGGRWKDVLRRGVDLGLLATPSRRWTNRQGESRGERWSSRVVGFDIRDYEGVVELWLVLLILLLCFVGWIGDVLRSTLWLFD